MAWDLGEDTEVSPQLHQECCERAYHWAGGVPHHGLAAGPHRGQQALHLLGACPVRGQHKGGRHGEVAAILKCKMKCK